MVLKPLIASWCAVTCTCLIRRNQRWQRLACVLACLPGVAYAEVIRLGGPRDIVVDVEDVRGGFSVAVEMRPVSCFDTTTNARINRSKAQLYGFVGLGKSLGIDATRLSVGGDVSGVTVESVEPGAQRYRLVFFVPEVNLNGLENGANEPATVGGPVTLATTSQALSQLFTCVHDHETTIEEIKKVFAEQVSQVVAGMTTTASSASVEEQAQLARVALTALEAEARKAFSATKKAFEEDLRVLSVEKEGLSITLARAQGAFEAAKNEALAEAEKLAGLSVERPASDEGPVNTIENRVSN